MMPSEVRGIKGVDGPLLEAKDCDSGEHFEYPSERLQNISGMDAKKEYMPSLIFFNVPGQETVYFIFQCGEYVRACVRECVCVCLGVCV